MIKLHSIAQIEKEYNFVPAVAGEDILNGEIGTVDADGKFTVDADGTSVVAQVEEGDDAGLTKYPIAEGTPIRTLDLTKMVGEKLDVYGYPLPSTYAVGTVVGKMEVTEIIGNYDGAVVEVQA